MGYLHVTTAVKSLYIPNDEGKIIMTNLPLEVALHSQDIAQNVAVCIRLEPFLRMFAMVSWVILQYA